MRNEPLVRAAVIGALFLSACTPATAPGGAPEPDAGVGLPAIPGVRGPLEIRVVHPTPAMPKPRTDSTFIYGSLGTGEASLAIDGAEVEVAPNGAFLAYLPVPEDGVWNLEARSGLFGRQQAAVAYRQPAPAPTPSQAPAPPAREEFSAPREAVVTGGADTLATGSDVAIGRTAPTGTYRWFLPRGARLAAVAREGEMVRVRLDSGTTAFLPAASLTLGTGAGAPRADVGAAAFRPAETHLDLVIPAAHRAFRVETDGPTLSVTLYDATPPAEAPQPPQDALVEGASWRAPAAGQAALVLRLREEPWGYKAFYDEAGNLVVRVRRAPRIDPGQPLRGLRIVVDPGHPPGGATGPTGLREGDANLAISLRLANRLREAGAEVLMTRVADIAVPLADRVNMAVAEDAHLLVSVHNNAFPEGVNPFRNHGTSTYFFHPFSQGLARALNESIVETTRIPDLGARQGNLALVRPTWMPSALTESLFMAIPRQEAALRNERFLDRLADAHVRGLTVYLRERALRAAARP